MVDRIVLHAPSALPEETSKVINSYSAHYKFSFVIFAICYIIKVDSRTPNAFTLSLIISFVFILIGLIQTRNRFNSAVIEISSFGVQLISFYGSGSSHDNRNNDAASRDEKNVLKIAYQKHNKRLLNKTRCKRQVFRAFIPRERIIDVIVMEIVWPHCVWSQVAFRVDKGCGSFFVQSSKHHNGIEHDRRRRQHHTSSFKDDAHVYDCIQSKDGEKDTGTDDQFTTRSQSTQTLMKKNRVAIVPAFPDECRGLLSYKECLRLQQEIERLLWSLKTR